MGLTVVLKMLISDCAEDEILFVVVILVFRTPSYEFKCHSGMRHERW